MAIVDIKDKARAERTHELVLNNIDIKNLVSKMVDIYIFKIGGSPYQ